MDYKALYEQQLAENKELKDKNKELKNELDVQVHLKENVKTKRIQLEKFKKDVIDATQLDDDLEDQEYIDYIKEMESEYDPELKEKYEKGVNHVLTLTDEIKELKKSEKYLYQKLLEEQESHSETLNNMLETFNLQDGTTRNAENHANRFTNAESKEGHYRTLIGKWYLMCFKEKIKELKKQVEDSHQKGFDAGREEYQVDKEFLDEKDEEIKELKEEIEGDGWLKQGYKTDLSNSHKQQNRMVKEIVKLKQENKELEASLLTWKMSRALRDTEINELKQQALFLRAECYAGGWSGRDNDVNQFADDVLSYFKEYKESDNIENVEELYKEWKEWACIQDEDED